MKTTNKEEFEKQNVFGMGNANTAYAQYFSGESFLNPLTKPETGVFNRPKQIGKWTYR